jgi:DNA phosphorothioation-associated DGQHR protein 1
MSTTYPIERPAFLVQQPFGDFVVASVPARVLLETAYSDRLKAVKQPDGSYRLDGSQRALAEPRLRDIGKFIDIPAAAFPNTIILAANYREDDGLIEGEEGSEDEKDKAIESKWSFQPSPNGKCGTLKIPSAEKLAAIIDGQHRLFGFNYISHPDRLDFPLLCAIYFDLPKPYQAFLFATVNANQRPVSKSQTYELFGYNVEDEPPEKWTPEKLAVFLTRKLNVEAKSPFHRHILVPAENSFSPTIGEIRQSGDWAVSTATIVEGIVKLISTNPKRDAYEMHGGLDYKGRDRSVLNDSVQDDPPLRGLYLAKNDELIYTGVKNYFTAVNRLFWEDAKPTSLIRKTVGVQALFDVARPIMKASVSKKDFSEATFGKRLQPASKVDFADSFFQTSGTGRGRIRTTIELCLGLRNYDKVKQAYVKDYIRLVGEFA